MSIDWNPYSTGTKGLERRWPIAKSYALDSATKLLGMSLDQSVSQNIGTIKVPILALPVRGGTYVLEVFDNEDAVADVGAEVDTLTAYPNEDVSGVGASAWDGNGGDTTNIYEKIDEAAPSASDYIRVLAARGLQTYTGRMSTGSLTLTNKRIVAVRLKCHASAAASGAAFQLGLDIGGTEYLSGVFTGLGKSFSVSASYAYEYEWTVNPATGLAWTIADVQSFDTSNEWLVKNLVATSTYIHDVQMEVDVQTAAENRLAFGVLDDSASALVAGAWNTVTLTTPTGGTWTKDGSGRHLYVLRRTSATGSLVVPLLDGDLVDFASGWRPTAEASSGLVTAMGDERTEVFGLIQRTTAPADSDDSLPYVQLVDAQVFTGQTAEQEFSDAAAVSYGQVRFLAKPNGATAPLSVKIKRRSDDVQLGSTLTFDPDDVLALPNEGGGWRLCDDTLGTPAGLATATQYYLEFSSTAAGTGSNYWSVLAYDTWDDGNAKGFGGTTDRAKVNGTEADRYDIPVTVAVTPDAMTGGAVELQQLLLTDGAGLAVADIDYASVSWDTTALGGEFGHYQVQRDDDGEWHTIARIYDEDTLYFNDIEGRRNVAADYRVRVVAASGATSPWESCGTATATLRAGLAVFATNFELESSLAFATEDSPAWRSLDGTVLAQPAGLDGSYAFRGTERRYRAGTAAIWPVEQLSVTGRTGIGVFDALTELLAMQIPYLAVLDARGDRWLADVVVGDETEAGDDTWRQAITLTELTRTPVPVQITAVPA